jgi:hypothetical protein
MICKLCGEILQLEGMWLSCGKKRENNTTSHFRINNEISRRIELITLKDYAVDLNFYKDESKNYSALYNIESHDGFQMHYIISRDLPILKFSNEEGLLNKINTILAFL